MCKADAPEAVIITSCSIFKMSHTGKNGQHGTRVVRFGTMATVVLLWKLGYKHAAFTLRPQWCSHFPPHTSVLTVYLVMRNVIYIRGPTNIYWIHFEVVRHKFACYTSNTKYDSLRAAWRFTKYTHYRCIITSIPVTLFKVFKSGNTFERLVINICLFQTRLITCLY